jgi:hypothetical protein
VKCGREESSPVFTDRRWTPSSPVCR